MSNMRELGEIKRFKLDNHNILTARFIFEDFNIIHIDFNYNNNYSNIILYYDLTKKNFLYGYDKILTDRQKKILENKILKFYEVLNNE